MVFLRWIAFPVASLILGIWTKWQTRVIQGKGLQRGFVDQDFAVGIDLYRTTMMALVLFTLERVIRIRQVNEAVAQAFQGNSYLTPDISTLIEEGKRLAAGLPNLFVAAFVLAFLFLAFSYCMCQVVGDDGRFSKRVISISLAAGIATTLIIPFLFFRD